MRPWHKILSFALAMALAIVLVPGGFAQPVQVKAATVTWDVGVQGVLTIPGNSTDDYFVTGTLTDSSTGTTSDRGLITVEDGYKGTITLSNVRLLTKINKPAIILYGNQNNANPSTLVNLIIEGNNFVHGASEHTKVGDGTSNYSDYGGITVCTGVTLTIDGTGTLEARATHKNSSKEGNGGGAAIGGGGGSLNYTGELCGGNIHIKGGTINAYGAYHAAAVGGGIAPYNGTVIVSGGKLNCYGGAHGAGIGGGCKNTGAGGSAPGTTYGTGIVVVLPPADVNAVGGEGGKYTVGMVGDAVYIGDPSSPQVVVSTETNEINANIYFDLSNMTTVVDAFANLNITDFDLNRVYVGQTNSTGKFTVRAELTTPTTIYTDSTCTNPDPAKFGKPFEPVAATTPSGGNSSTVVNVVLPLLSRNLTVTKIDPLPLIEGYTASDAAASAFTLKLEYSDSSNLDNVTFDVLPDAYGVNHFKAMQCYQADGVTPVTKPTTLTNGDVYILKVPLQDGKPVGLYQATFKMQFTMGIATLPLLYPIDQKVTREDSNYQYIKLTANPVSFISNNNPSQSVALSLNIDLTGTGLTYSSSDTEGEYIITTQKNYASISPTDPGWKPLNLPASNGSTAVTTATFPTTMAVDTYYIHWRATSGTYTAHSKDFVDPAAQYGAFGPYIIDKTAPTATIVVNNNPAATQEISDFSALPVKITFGKSIDPASFTVSDFTITPSGLGTFTALAVVAGSDDKEFTATFTPSSSMYNGQEVKIKLPAGSVTDKAGNASTADSNEVTLRLKMDSDIPTVSFQNQPEYDTLTPSFDIGLEPGDTSINSNTSLFTDAAATIAIANGQNIASLFTVRKVSDGTVVSSGDYTVIYDAAGKKAVISFAVSANLSNSTDYSVSIAQNTLYNKLKNGNVATSCTFRTAVPEVTGITPASTTLPADASGAPVLTVNGFNFNHIASGVISVEQTNPDGTTVTLTATVNSPTTATLTVTIPANSDNVTKTYSFQAKSPVLSGTDEGLPAQIHVSAATPGLSPTDVLTADPDFIENDDVTFLGGDSVLTVTGQNLHNFTVLEIHCDDGNVYPIAPSDISADKTKASITVSFPYNSAVADKVYTFEVYFNGTASGHTATVTVEGSKPKVTSVTANPDAHSSAGGSSVLTIQGRYLNLATLLELVDKLGGTYTISPADIAADGRSATITISFTGNAGPRNDIHVLEAYVDGIASGQSATVEVGDSIPFVEDARANPYYFKPEDIKNNKGTSKIMIYGGYLTKASSLELYDVVNRTTYTVSVVYDDYTSFTVTVPSNLGVYTYNVLLDGVDTGVAAYIQVGGTPPPDASEIPPPEEDLGGDEDSRSLKDKHWTGRGGGAKGGVWSGGWEWDTFDILYHHARAAVKETPDNAIVVLKDVWCIPQGKLNRAASGARADRMDGSVTIHFDTMNEYQPSLLEGRLIINPKDANFFESHLYPMVFTRKSLTEGTKSLFAERFDNNNIAVIRLSQIGKYYSKMEIAANVELKGFDKDNLYFYLCIPETGEYRRMSNPDYFFGEDGYLHFFTYEGGDIVVTDKPLTQNGAAFQPGFFPVDRKNDEDEEE